MIRSMTGYGKVQQFYDSRRVVIEIKSLNSKQFDLSMRLPADLRLIEFELRNKLSEAIQRGKVDFTINFEDQDQKRIGRIDKEVAAAGYKQLQELAWDLQFKMPEDVAAVLTKFPGFFAVADTTLPDDFIEFLLLFSNEAIAEFDAYRLQEGEMLKKDILPRIEQIMQLLIDVEHFEDQRNETLKARLLKNVTDVADRVKFDANRFEQELIYYLEKLDISEEKTRLKQNCTYFLETISEDNAGKKLGFISQEMGREINTLGSKANDASIQRLVVQMKDELEKVKEQLFNVL